ncbi:MAG: hypothetical protein KTR24_08775 [Saprospiraceae bacterium]|nr:hypothetical protein [Saprospiraceae bacterium]
MTRNCTQNDLIQFMYGDLPKDACTSVVAELDTEGESQRDYAALQKAQKHLPKVSFAPSQSSIDRILEFSRKTAIAAHWN